MISMNCNLITSEVQQIQQNGFKKFCGRMMEISVCMVSKGLKDQNKPLAKPNPIENNNIIELGIDVLEDETMIPKAREQEILVIIWNFDELNDSSIAKHDIKTIKYKITYKQNKIELKNDKNTLANVVKKDFLLSEMINTEKDYVQNLGLIVEGYMATMEDPNAKNCSIPIPEDLNINSTQYALIFRHIKLIYEWHRDEFLQALEECHDQVHKFPVIFKKFNNVIYAYSIYLQKAKIANILMLKHQMYFENMQVFLGHRIDIFDLMAKPLQRICKYGLLLQKIMKSVKKTASTDLIKSLQNTLDGMHELTSDIDYALLVNKIHNFNGNINTRGKLLFHGPLSCGEVTSGLSQNKVTYRNLYVFLFEQIMIFTVEDTREKSYDYKYHISIKDISEEPCKLDNGSFIIKSKTNLSIKEYECLPVKKLEITFQWIEELQKLYKMQNDFLDQLMNPIRYLNNNLNTN